LVTRETFWDIMGAYGARIWPVQIIFYAAAILLVGWLLVKPGRLQSQLVKLFLSIAFAWNAIMFYMVLAAGMAGGSHGNYFFGALFVLVAVLFAVDLFKQRMQFSLPATGWRKGTTLLLAGLVFCYPVFGKLGGHALTSLIVPGTFPCPTIALALLLLTIALPRVDKVAYSLLIFCGVPFTPFFQIARYGVYEDLILLAVGIYSLVLLVRYWHLPVEAAGETPRLSIRMRR
jgi:hypothetical protein